MQPSELRMRYEAAFDRLLFFIRDNPNHPKIALVRTKLVSIPRIIAYHEITDLPRKKECR